jgi:hypothetical protein
VRSIRHMPPILRDRQRKDDRSRGSFRHSGHAAKSAPGPAPTPAPSTSTPSSAPVPTRPCRHCGGNHFDKNCQAKSSQAKPPPKK